MTTNLPECQHCSDPVPTAKSKQCIPCRDMKNVANRYGNYGATMRRLEEAKAKGLRGQAVREYVLEQERIAVENAKVADAKAKAELEQRQREHQQRRAERDAQNAHLKVHGYTWSKVAVGTEDDVRPGSYGAGYGEFSHHEWQLWSPDGRAVSVEQALDEIERGVEVVRAEREAARRQQAEQAKAEADDRAIFGAAWSDAQSMTEVEPFATDTLTVVATRQRGSVSDRVQRGTIAGVVVAVTKAGASDGDPIIRYWCADPAAAGLVPAQRDEIEGAWLSIFG